jgi:hypothetical protein
MTYPQPWVTREECDIDHKPGESCSHCCPCADCTAERAMLDEEQR